MNFLTIDLADLHRELIFFQKFYLGVFVAAFAYYKFTQSKKEQVERIMNCENMLEYEVKQAVKKEQAKH